MRIPLRPFRALGVAIVAGASLAPTASTQQRTRIALADSAVSPENLTSSRDGTVYFGSMTTGTIYRALPGAARAEPWILASAAGLTRVLGVLADDRSNTLWVCQNATGGAGGAAVAGRTALRAFDLTSGAARGTYPFPPNSRICNDIAVSADGTAYVSESYGGRVHRLKPGAGALEVWASDSAINVIDGLALLADGSLYVNDIATGRLFRIPVKGDGSAGAIVPIETSMRLGRPDGLRTAGPRTLIQAEQAGRVTELTIEGDRAEVRVVQDGLTRPSGVTIVGDSAIVLVEFSRAVAVPYRAGSRRSNDEGEILALSRTKWRWMADRKVDSLAALFGDDAVFVHMGGTMSRSQELDVIRGGAIQYKHAEIEEASVRFLGNTAILLNRIRLDAVVGGNEVSNPFMVTEVYVRQGDAWRLGSLSFTRLLQ